LSPLEVASALKKDAKPKELIELDLRELRRHKISFVDNTQAILRSAERTIAAMSIYASDALHAATFQPVSRRKPLDGMLSDDRDYDRLNGIIKILTLKDVGLDSSAS
jgi:hypothetical protein